MRIRTLKPDFFRHELLQELGAINMLVFAGLWCASDKEGNFLWNEKVLKLDILPFIKYEIGSSLEVLRKNGLIEKKIGDDGKVYGYIPTFLEHQRFSGTESQNPAKFGHISMKDYDGSSLEVPRKLSGSTEEARIKEEGIRKKEEGIRNKFFACFLRKEFDTLSGNISNKKSATENILKSLKTNNPENIYLAIIQYLNTVQDVSESKFIKRCHNFFGKDKIYEDFLPNTDDPEIKEKLSVLKEKLEKELSK